MRVRLLSLALVSSVLSACGGDSATGPGSNPPAPTFENIADTYAGILVGIAQGIALDGTFSVTITQSAGTLSGSWSISGTLTDATGSVFIQGTGSLSGTINSGQNPSVNITITTGLCPNYQAVFSGAYDSTNRRLTLSGPIDILDLNSCNVLLTYPSTIILIR
jgi:hypothetical protein